MEQNYPPPVYPKDDPEYRKRIMEEFYKKVRETNWGVVEEGEYQGKPRGRKAKIKERLPTKPRTEGERKVVNEYQNKFFKY